VAIPTACVGVFTEAGHKLIAVAPSRGKGGGLSPANAKLRIEPSRSKKTLVVQLRPAGLDTGLCRGEIGDLYCADQFSEGFWA
jgi:hypothetical protein